MIVFFGNCSFRNLDYVPNDTSLIHSSRVTKAVKKILDQNNPVKYRNKREIVNLLSAASLNGEKEEIKIAHINNIRRNFGY